MIFIFVMMLVFVSTIQPIMMVLVLMLMTLICSFDVMLVLGNFWFSYILLLVVLSGVMVLFMYMSSLIPNESFEMINLFLFLILIVFFIKDFFFEVEMDNSIVSLNLWVWDLSYYNLYLVFYLFGIMVSVVWVSCSDYLSVRV